MTDRAWPDGPTWEEIVRRGVGTLAAKQRSRKRLTIPLWSLVRDLFCYGSTYSVQLCRACGFDATTGERIEEVMDDK